jgi:hypothetical protein
MLVATFLPWISQPTVAVEESAAHPFRGGTAQRSFSGWELKQRCGQPGDLGSCSLPSGAYEGRESIPTGQWTLVIGAGFVLLAGGLTIAMMRGSRVGWRLLLAISWVAAIFVGFFVMFLWSQAANLISSTVAPGDQPYTRQLPDPVQYGIVLVAIAAGLGLLGTVIATLFGRKKATSPDEPPPGSTSSST